MKAKYAFVAGLLCASGYVSGQSIIEGKKNEDLSLLLEEVVVTGTGTDHYLKEAPVQTEVITKRALEQYQARTIEELLNGLSPSISFMDGSMGNHIQLNGLSNDYILIMIDGKRMNGDVGGQNDLNMLNPAHIERIEIVKGAASSLYGSDAIAGVINIITKKNLSKQELTSTSRVGEYGDVRESISLGWTFGKVKSVTALDFHHTDGWRNTDLQWNQQQLKPGSTQKNSQSFNQLYIIREAGMGGKQTANPICLSQLLRALGGSSAWAMELPRQRFLLPQLWVCHKREIQIKGTKLLDCRSLLRPIWLFL